MTTPVESLAELFAELRRRRVVRSALVYIGGAFVTLEMTGVAVDTYGLPGGLQQVMGILAILGFPLALFLAWRFDWKDGRIEQVRDGPLPEGLGAGLVRTSFAAVLVVSAGAAAAVLWRDASSPTDTNAGSTPAVAVLPVEWVTNDTLAWLTPALEGRVEGALADAPGLHLRSGRAVAAYESLPLDSMARVLDVDFFVQIRVEDVDSSLSAMIELIDAASSTVVASRNVAAPADNRAIGLVAGLASAIEQVLRTALGQEVRVREWRATTDNPLAFELRHRAEERWRAAEAHLQVDPSLVLRELAAADSLLALSVRQDPDWAEARVARAHMAERTALARLIASRGRNTEGVVSAVDAGIRHADDALERSDDLPKARAVRGRLLYLKARFADVDPETRAGLVDRAEAELRAAFREDPSLAEAAATLSQLLFRERADYPAARWFAEQAYRVDAYLESSSAIIDRIAESAFEMGDDSAAMEWCREGVRRHPDLPVHHGCVVEVTAWGQGPFDPDTVWHHYRQVVAHGISGNDYSRRFYRMVMASALARAGLADSARAVMADVKAQRATNPVLDSLDFMELEAAVRFRLGEIEAGRRLFEEIRRRDPGAGARAAASRRLRDFLPLGPG